MILNLSLRFFTTTTTIVPQFGFVVEVTRFHHVEVSASIPVQPLPPLYLVRFSQEFIIVSIFLGRLVKHLYDWMDRASNLAKGAPLDSRETAAKCVLCGKPETQAQNNTSCSHPALMDLRHLHQRQIDLYLLAVRCTPLPPNTNGSDPF